MIRRPGRPGAKRASRDVYVYFDSDTEGAGAGERKEGDPARGATVKEMNASPNRYS